MQDAPGEHPPDPIPHIATELRALEWELSEAIRRMEMVRDKVQELQSVAPWTGPGEDQSAGEAE